MNDPHDIFCFNIYLAYYGAIDIFTEIYIILLFGKYQY